MTSPPPRRSVGAAVAWMLLPTVAALALLVLGIATTTLVLVYASIALSVLAVPAFVAGVVVLVRR